MTALATQQEKDFATRIAHHEREQARLERLIRATANILMRRVAAETPKTPLHQDLLEQWVGALQLSLDHASNPKALQFAQDLYRQLHAANHPE